MRISVEDNIRQGNYYFSNKLAHFTNAVCGDSKISKKDISVARLTVASIAATIFLVCIKSNWAQAQIPFSSNFLDGMRKLENFTGIKDVTLLTLAATSFMGTLGFSYFAAITKADCTYRRFSYFAAITKADGPYYDPRRISFVYPVASAIFTKIFGND